MDANRNFAGHGSSNSISNKEDREVALRHIDSFIKFKEHRRIEYNRIAKDTPSNSIRLNLEYIMSRENECLKEARELRNIIESDRLGEVKLRKTKDFQVYDHFERQNLDEVDTLNIKDILMAALAEDKDMIDRLKLLAVEYIGTRTENAAKHLMNSIIGAKNDITDRLLKLEQWDW